jgi:hypothetical protein
VNQHEDQLSEAFQAHENLSPDPAAVYARVQELSKGYVWRRRGVQAAGGAVLGAGLIAGSFAVPNLLHESGRSTVNVSAGVPAAAAPAPAATKPRPTPSASPTLTEQEKDWQAYFAAGYTYDDAVRLAKLWHKKNIGAVKAEAGHKLRAHQPLPFKPDPKNVAQAKLAAQMEAFWNAGYGYEDAVKLAKLWKISDVSQAKAEAGKKLLAGQTLPFKPTPVDENSQPDAKQLQAFFGAGYDYDDAVKLAGLWKLADPYAAKIAGGDKLLAGETLPIKATPDDNGGVDTSPSAIALNAYFNAGYDWNDAVKLAKLWKLADPSDAKVAAGKKLLAGETLPIKP